MTRRLSSTPRRFHSVLGRLTIGIVSFAGNGFAQSASRPADAPASDTAPNGADAPDNDVVREAGEHYGRGLSLYSEGDYALAVIEFDRAYALVSDYRVLYNVGQVRIQLGNYAKARVALEGYLKAGGDKVSPDRLHSVESDLKMIGARTATLRIETNIEGATISVDDETVGTSPLADPLLLDAGDHRLGVRKAGFNPADARYTLAGGDTSSTRLDLTAEVRSAGPRIIVEKQYLERSDRTTWLWATWAATGVFAAGGVTLGALGLKSANDLDNLRHDDQATRSQLDSTQRRARTLLGAGDILGGAAIVTGGIALYLTLSNRGESPKASASRQIRPQLNVAVTPTWIGLRGSY